MTTTTKKAVAAATAGETPVLSAFPIKQAHRFALTTRKAFEKGEVSCTFSLRKLLLWAETDGLLQMAGFSRDDALAFAFHLAIEAKTYGVDREFLRNLYQTVFAKEPKLPALPVTHAHLHPLAGIVEILMGAGLPLWIYGPTGSSKSHSVEAIALQLGRPYIRIQGTGELTVDDIIGSKGATAGSTHFEYGPLPVAMRTGAVLNVDEVATIPPQVLFEFQAVLEGKPLVIKQNGGEVVSAVPGFTIVMNDNTMGLGEGTSYIGTHTQNEAFRDRFVFLEMAYMDPKNEAKILAKALDDLTARRGWVIADPSAPKAAPTAAPKTGTTLPDGQLAALVG